MANLERAEQLLDADVDDHGGRCAGPAIDVTALFVESMNEGHRPAHLAIRGLGVYARVPPTVLLLLVAGVILSLGAGWLYPGLAEKRSPIIAIVLVIALGATLWLVIDLDRPRRRFDQTSQQPLIDLQQKLGSPSSEGPLLEDRLMTVVRRALTLIASAALSLSLAGPATASLPGEWRARLGVLSG